MNLQRYDFSTNTSYLDFEFVSEGPKGKISKIVRYSPQNANGITYFNLGFGDLDKRTGKIDDLSITNNLDREKVLATVAATIMEFTQHFPDVMVYAKGSTPSRTRLYQMGTMANWDKIEPFLYVYGFFKTNWLPFEVNINY